VASPYAERADDLTPRVVATLPVNFASPVAVGFGHALIGAFSSASLYRLADGRRTDLSPPAGFVWVRGRAVYVGPEELAYAIVDDRTLDEHFVRFVRYAELETP